MCLQEKYPWIDTATSEDFPTEDLKLMASIIGMSATIKLLTEATGCVFTMTKYWDRELIKRYIKRVYDGTKRSRNVILGLIVIVFAVCLTNFLTSGYSSPVSTKTAGTSE